TQLVRNLPSGTLADSEQKAVVWVGKLREYVERAVRPERRPPPAAIEALDAAIAARGEAIASLYQQGRNATSDVIKDFTRKILASADSSEQLRLELVKAALRHYAAFSMEDVAPPEIANLDAD